MDAELAAYVEILRAGGVIACATETLFGLLADARSEAAIARVVAIKQRGESPIALLAPDLACVEALAELSEAARALAARYWPGPLTLVVRAKPGLPAALLRDGTVGVRVPGPSPALTLVRAFGGPLTATSCNPSGLPAARDADEARVYFGAQLGQQLAAIVPGSAPGGAASTLIDATTPALRVLRQGAIELARA
ncbi:MAG: Sua5/YciO/YrdC/YwlC family protein [Myxococcaceae bacterium]|nr:Sua5/YciO/YrdC/YwlC family protein [Myxococcaceae bacterium]